MVLYCIITVTNVLNITRKIFTCQFIKVIFILLNRKKIDAILIKGHIVWLQIMNVMCILN